MKKIMTLCAACLLVLSGCTGGEETVTPPASAPVTAAPSATPLVAETPLIPATPEPTPVETTAPVETEAPDVPPPVETEPPPEGAGDWDGSADALTLNDFPTQLSSSEEVLAATAAQPDESASLLLIAQLPENDTWLYGVYGPQKDQSLILRVGTRWEQFNIPFLTPRGLLPEMYYGDFDGDMSMELAILSYTGSGTGVSIWDLAIVEFGDGGSWSSLTFDPADYTAILDQSIGCTYDPETNVATLQAGDSTLTLNFTDWGYPDPGEPVTAFCGQTVSFRVDGDALYGSFSIGVGAPNVPPAALLSVAELRADVVYTGSAFGLNALAFYAAPGE